jgi:hypothetical protein
MKICWDNLEKVKITKNGNFYIGKHAYYELLCLECSEIFLGTRQSKYCNHQCQAKSQLYKDKLKSSLMGKNTGENNPMFGRKGNRHPNYGKPLSPERRKKIGEQSRNRRHSDETKQKCGNVNRGKKFSEEHRRKISIGVSGSNNYNWRGGISCEPYCQQWTDKEYKDWLINKRDAGKCQNSQCNGKSKKICLHHINYDKKDCRPANLITLCISCNSKANKDREWHESWYSLLLKRRIH